MYTSEIETKENAVDDHFGTGQRIKGQQESEKRQEKGEEVRGLWLEGVSGTCP